MAQKTLFSLLLGLPWWISALVAVAFFGFAQMIFPPVAPFVALPFFGIAFYVGYRQLRTVSPGRVEQRLQAARELSWEQFSNIVCNAYRGQGYTVESANKSAFDFTLAKQGRVTLLQCRRWKVQQLGVGPLQELVNAVAGLDAYNGICITAGNLTPQAREFAVGKPISLVSGSELAVLLGKLGSTRK
jgi:restriction system protein